MERLDQLLTARRGLAQALMQLRQQQAGLALCRPGSGAGGRPAGRPTQDPRPADRRARPHRHPGPEHQRQHQRRPCVRPLVTALDRVPGIGPVTAAALACCLESKAFPDPDAFVAYVGLDVRVRDAGAFRGPRKLTKHGDAELRRLLYLCAQASLRSKDSPFAEQYARERKKGLSTTAARVAVARKLAKVAWSLARYRTEYDPARVYTQPKGGRSVPPAALDRSPEPKP